MTTISSDDAAPASEQSRIDRRTAMKAALGGAAVAAAWTAPRIEGLSLAPDFAAAASCSGGSIGTITKNSNNCGTGGSTECFGGNCCNTVSMGGATVAGNNFSVNANIGGEVNGDSGFVNFTVSGIDPPFQRCTVNVSGNCNNDGSFRGGGSYVFNTNGNQNSFIDCQGGGNFTEDDPDAQIRLNMTCECRNT